jgi:hypothetical protein
MLPDSVYNIDIRVTNTDGIEYQNPNYRNFSIDLLRKLDIETQAFFNLSLETALETFHPLGTKAYGLSISVKDNPYPSMKYEYPLDWANYNTLAFRGINGKKGEDGDPGFPSPILKQSL